MLTVTLLFVLAALIFVLGNMAGKSWAPCWTWGLLLVLLELLRVVPLR